MSFNLAGSYCGTFEYGLHSLAPKLRIARIFRFVAAAKAFARDAVNSNGKSSVGISTMSLRSANSAEGSAGSWAKAVDAAPIPNTMDATRKTTLELRRIISSNTLDDT